MSTVDSNDKSKQEDKLFFEKKTRDNNQFIELCYKVLYAAINMHHNMMQRLNEAREKAESEGKNKILQEKTREEFINSIRAYNDAINKLITKDTRTEDKELLDRLKQILDSILAQINKINLYIQDLNQRISERKAELTIIKMNLADEIKRFFVESNPDINIRTQVLSISLTPDLKNKLGMESIDIDVDKLIYLRFAKLIADRLADDQFQFHQFQMQARQAAIEIIRNEILAKISHLPQSEREKIINNIMGQKETAERIEQIAGQLPMQFFRHLSKEPAMATLFKNGCSAESDIEKFNIEKENEIIKRDKLISKSAQASQALKEPNLLPSQIRSTLETARAASIEAENPTPLFTKAITVIVKTEELTKELEKIKEEAKTELTSETASEKLAEHISQVQKITSSQEELLDLFDDFLPSKDTSKPPTQPSSTHTPG